MGVTKTDFVRGLQCPKMLWLDSHKPEEKYIPAAVQRRLDLGNEFGDFEGEIQAKYAGLKDGSKTVDDVVKELDAVIAAN